MRADRKARARGSGRKGKGDRKVGMEGKTLAFPRPLKSLILLRRTTQRRKYKENKDSDPT
jgi:hypothetical protein